MRQRPPSAGVADDRHVLVPGERAPQPRARRARATRPTCRAAAGRCRRSGSCRRRRRTARRRRWRRGHDGGTTLVDRFVGQRPERRAARQLHAAVLELERRSGRVERRLIARRARPVGRRHPGRVREAIDTLLQRVDFVECTAAARDGARRRCAASRCRPTAGSPPTSRATTADRRPAPASSPPATAETRGRPAHVGRAAGTTRPPR